MCDPAIPNQIGFLSVNGICFICKSIDNMDAGTCACKENTVLDINSYPPRCFNCTSNIGMYVDGTACKKCSDLPATGTLTSFGCSICDIA